MMMEELLDPLRAMLGVCGHSLEVESFAGLRDAGVGADDDGGIVGSLWMWRVLCRTL